MAVLVIGGVWAYSFITAVLAVIGYNVYFLFCGYIWSCLFFGHIGIGSCYGRSGFVILRVCCELCFILSEYLIRAVLVGGVIFTMFVGTAVLDT